MIFSEVFVYQNEIIINKQKNMNFKKKNVEYACVLSYV